MSSPTDPREHQQSRNRRRVIRIRESSETDKRQEAQTPSREESCRSRQLDSRRGLSRNSRQPTKPPVVWLKGKTISGSLQEMMGGDFKSVNFSELGRMDGDEDGDLGQAFSPNPDEFSLGDKICEEDNEVYSSTQNNDEESHRDPNEKSQDALAPELPASFAPFLNRRKDPTLLETLYDHKAQQDQERVSNARRRLEEKYSGSRWKMTNELLLGPGQRKQPFPLSRRLGQEPTATKPSAAFTPGKSFYKTSTSPGPDAQLTAATAAASSNAYSGVLARKLIESVKENSLMARAAQGSDTGRSSKASDRNSRLARGTFYQLTSNSKSPSRVQKPPSRSSVRYADIASKFTRTTNGERFLKVT